MGNLDRKEWQFEMSYMEGQRFEGWESDGHVKKGSIWFFGVEVT